MVVRALLDAGALAGLILGAALGAHHHPDGIRFIAFCLGTASGYRVIGAAFRRGRRRQGRDPEPSRGAARILGGFIGFWIKLILGFACWALLLQFFRRAY